MAILGAAAPSSADPPPIYRFIVDDLTSFEAELIDLDPASARFDTGNGIVQSMDTERLLGIEALRFEGPGTRQQPAWATGIRSRLGLIRMADGRRFTGAPSTVRNDDETLLWDHALLGRLAVPLEQIDRVQQPRTFIGTGLPGIIPPATDSDRVLLINGDELEGFLVEAGTVFTIETDTGEVAVQQGDIDQYALANPAELLSGPVLWLADGSVIGAPSLRVTGGLIELGAGSTGETEAERPLTQNGHEQSWLLDADGMLAYVPDARRLVPLGSLPEADTLVRESAAAEPFNARPLVWSSPGETVFMLPGGATWFAASITLPIEARAWGDATLIVLADNTELARVPLNAASPTGRVRVQLDGRRTLTIRLEAGAFGPVQVEARLEDAVIAVE
ncbi:MAG: hypothetical protein AAGB48_10205 [Planctomycetota bacterium]